MNLEILLPQKRLLDVEITRLVAESTDGSFCLLPRHIDTTAAIVPGLLAFETASDRRDVFAAVDEGVLTKAGSQVRVAVRRAVLRDDLIALEDTVETVFRHHTEPERRARRALARLESNFVRRLLELKRP